MKAKVRLSVKEMGLLCQRVLAASKMAPGCVDAAARMVQWTEVVLGRGLLMLRETLKDLAGDPVAPMPITVQTDSTAIIDGDGLSSLVTGPGALDVASAKARRFGLGAVEVRGSRHPGFLGCLAEQGAQRGLACLVVSDEETRLAVPTESGLIMAVRPRTAARSQHLIASSLLTHGGLKHVLHGLSPGQAFERLFDGLSDEPGNEDSPDSRDVYAIVCVDASALDSADATERKTMEALQRVKAGRQSRDLHVYGAQEWRAIWRRAAWEGVVQDRELWLALTAFADTTLVPATERSFFGAG